MGSSKQVRFSDTHDVAGEIIIFSGVRRTDLSNRVTEMKMKLAKQKLRQHQQEEARVVEYEIDQIVADERERDRNRKIKSATLLNEKQRHALILRETAAITRRQRERRRENEMAEELSKIDHQITQVRNRKAQLAEEGTAVEELLQKASSKIVRGKVLYSI